MKRIIKYEKKLYELLGVNIFRKYILLNLDKIYKIFGFSLNYKLKKININKLKRYKINLKCFGVAHGIALIIGILLNLNLPFIIINLYCILVQRYNRIRINEVLEKYEKLIELRKSKSERILLKDTTLNEPEQTLAKEKSIDDKLIKLRNIRKELLGLLYPKEQKTLPKSEKDKSIRL